MNLSHWDTYTKDQAVAFLGQIEMMTRSRRMPLRRYLLLHSDAKLSDADIDLLEHWTRAERNRLRSRMSP